MKYIFLLIPILAFSNPKTENYQEEINQLKLENSKLEIKIDTLNDVNDKILNTVYWTIGSVFTVFVGFNIISFFKANRDNNKALKEIKDQSSKEIKELVNIKSSELQTRFQKSYSNLYDDFLISLTDYHPYSCVLKDPINVIHKIISSKTHNLDDSIRALENYLEDLESKGEELPRDFRYEIISILKEEYNKDYLKNRVDNIVNKLDY